MDIRISSPQRPLTRSTCFVLMVCLGVSAAALSGCEDEPIRSYTAPKAEPYTPPAPIGPAVGPSNTPPQITWDTPESWALSAQGSSMAMATFEASATATTDETPGPARITVTPLTGEAGGTLGNINRWRGQVGLAPVQTDADQPMTPIRIDDTDAGVIDLTSPADANAGIDRMLVVLIYRQAEDQSWFIKMTGPRETLEQHKANFIAFCESIRFGGPADE